MPRRFGPFRIGWLMALVAAVALACGGFVLRQRSALYARMADIHRRLAEAERQKPFDPTPPAGFLPPCISVDLESRFETDYLDLQVAIVDRPLGAGPRVTAFHERMARRCEDAARRPWLAGPELKTPSILGTGYATCEYIVSPVATDHAVAPPAISFPVPGAEFAERPGEASPRKAGRP